MIEIKIKTRFRLFWASVEHTGIEIFHTQGFATKKAARAAAVLHLRRFAEEIKEAIEKEEAK